MSESPSPAWYDPPEPRVQIEIKRESKIDPTYMVNCERLKCVEFAERAVEVGAMNDANGTLVMVCKNHYESIIEDYVEIANEMEDEDDD